MQLISKKQIQLIKTLQRSIGIDDDTYREALQNRYHVDSCTKLSGLQATNYIRLLLNLQSGKSESKKRAPKPNDGACIVVPLATRPQRSKISALSRIIDWRVEGGYHRWTENRMGLRRVRTKEDAVLIIEGLKKMFENQCKSKYGDLWILNTANDPDVANYLLYQKVVE